MTTRTSAVLVDGLQRLGWTVSELWAAAAGIGGGFTARQVEAITSGESPATPMEHDILVAALNDQFVEIGEDHPLAYWAELPPTAV
jgi:hypothetical protein